MWKLLCLAAVAVVAPISRADEAAIKVVKKAMDAHGGEKALSAVKAGESTIKATISVMGMDIDFDGESAFAFPDKLSVSMNAEIMGQKVAIVQVVNGSKAKMTVNGMVIPLDDKQKDELKQGIATQELGLIVGLLDKKYTLVSDTDDKAGGEEAAVVRVSGKDLKDTKLFFSKKTGLLIRVQRRGLDQSGTEVDTVSDMSDFKKIDGILTPTAITVTQDGKKFMTMSLNNTKYSDKADTDRKFDVDDK